MSGWYFCFGGASSPEDKEMADSLRASVLLSLSRPVRGYEYAIDRQSNFLEIRFRRAGTTSSSQEGPGNLADCVKAIAANYFNENAEKSWSRSTRQFRVMSHYGLLQ